MLSNSLKLACNSSTSSLCMKNLLPYFFPSRFSRAAKCLLTRSYYNRSYGDEEAYATEIEKLQKAAAKMNAEARSINSKLHKVGPPETHEGLELRKLIQDRERFEQLLTEVEQRFLLDPRRSLLQLQFLESVHIICVVDPEYEAEVQQKLMHLMNLYGVSFADVESKFRSRASIEAYMTSEVYPTMKPMHILLNEEAQSAGAKSVSIKDGKTGLLRFECNSFCLEEVKVALRNRGFTIACIDMYFEPKKSVALNGSIKTIYERFLEALVEIPCVESVYDNVIDNAVFFHKAADKDEKI